MGDVHNALLLVIDYQVHYQESQIEKTEYVSLLCAREKRQLEDYELNDELHGLSELYRILALYLQNNLSSKKFFLSQLRRCNELVFNLIAYLFSIGVGDVVPLAMAIGGVSVFII